MSPGDGPSSHGVPPPIPLDMHTPPEMLSTGKGPSTAWPAADTPCQVLLLQPPTAAPAQAVLHRGGQDLTGPAALFLFIFPLIHHRLVPMLQRALPRLVTHREHQQQNSKQMSSKIIHKYFIAACEPPGERQRPWARSELITEHRQTLLIGSVAMPILLTAAERTTRCSLFALLWVPVLIKWKLKVMDKTLWRVSSPSY